VKLSDEHVIAGGELPAEVVPPVLRDSLVTFD
jgi:hypothetical protein